MSNIQQHITQALFEAFDFIEKVTENEKMLREVILGMGWELDALAGFSIANLSDALHPLSGDLKQLLALVDPPPRTFSDFEAALDLSERLFLHVTRLKDVLEDLEFDGPDKERLGEFAEDALNYIVVLFLGARFPVFYHLAVLLTLIRGEERLEAILDAGGKVIRHPKIVPAIDFGRLPGLLKNPVPLLQEEYFPNGLQTDRDAIIASYKLFPRTVNLLKELGIPAVMGYKPGHDVDFGEAGNKMIAGMMTVLVETEVEGQPLDFAVSLALSPASRGDLGLVVIPSGQFNFSHTIGDWWVNLNLTAGVEAFAVGREEVTLLAGAGTGALEAGIKLLKLRPGEDSPAFLLGSAQGTRLEIGTFLFSAGFGYHDDSMAVDLFAQSEKAAIVLSPGDGDGFIQAILPSDGFRLDFDLGVGWSNQKGLYFKGAAGLEAVYPVHKSVLNILTIEQFGLKLQAKESALHFESTVNLSLKIGPVDATVSSMGLRLSMDELGEPGNIGIADLSFAFAPPAGVGLRVDGGLISGGGFLAFDAENHRYAGVLSLDFQSIELAAIGLINTRLPNQQKGFSMLISISVLFRPAIQLSFGFTLNGVGGLIGIHRTMKVDVLRERIRSGAVKSIMFPENIIENAPKIISDLSAVFPPRQHHFVVAPFLKIGWGSRTVVEADLGILVEIPFKGRLILLGNVGVFLPGKEEAERLVELHVDVFGDFNFAESYMLIEGRLRDSRVVEVSLTGGFAFMLDWGPDPQFLFSIGGCHPRYKKPDRFPAIPRLTALIKKGSDIRLTCEYYQAITSNSYQIGFSADLVVKKGRARATGFLGFDALIQFDPFLFEADIRISVGLSYRGRTFAGIDLYFLLSGPKPWRAKGHARIKVLFFSLKVRFNYSWGGEQKIAPAAVKPDALLEQLKQQLEDERNWAGKLPARFSPAESLRTLEETEQQNAVFVHPSGFLELRQTLLPLNRMIAKFGNQRLPQKASFQIVSYELGKGDQLFKIEATQEETLLEYFSRGQFEELPDDEKISTADFDLMTAGLRLGPGQIYDFSTEMESTGNDFEDIILGETASVKPGQTGFNWQAVRSMNLAGIRRIIRPNRPEEVFGMVEEVPDQEAKGFKIVSKDSMEAPEDLWDSHFVNYSAAKEYLHGNWPEEERANWQILEVTAGEEEKVII